MTNETQQEPLVDTQPDTEAGKRLRKRNRIVGLALGFFVIALGVISYFRIKGLTP